MSFPLQGTGARVNMMPASTWLAHFSFSCAKFVLSDHENGLRCPAFLPSLLRAQCLFAFFLSIRAQRTIQSARFLVALFNPIFSLQVCGHSS